MPKDMLDKVRRHAKEDDRKMFSLFSSVFSVSTGSKPYTKQANKQMLINIHAVSIYPSLHPSLISYYDYTPPIPCHFYLVAPSRGFPADPCLHQSTPRSVTSDNGEIQLPLGHSNCYYNHHKHILIQKNYTGHCCVLLLLLLLFLALLFLHV